MNAGKLFALKKEIASLVNKEQQATHNLECLLCEKQDVRLHARFQLQRKQSIRHTYRLEAMVEVLNQAEANSSAVPIVIDQVASHLKLIHLKRSHPVRDCSLWQKETDKTECTFLMA